jgi:hypothetical protein
MARPNAVVDVVDAVAVLEVSDAVTPGVQAMRFAEVRRAMRIVIEIDGLTVADTTGAPRIDLSDTARVSPLSSEPTGEVETIDAGPAALPAELLATVGKAPVEGVAVTDALDAGMAPVLPDGGERSSIQEG